MSARFPMDSTTRKNGFRGSHPRKSAKQRRRSSWQGEAPRTNRPVMENAPASESHEPSAVAGTLEILPDGYGFLRDPRANYANSPQDVYVPAAQIRRLGLRTGMVVEGVTRPAM